MVGKPRPLEDRLWSRINKNGPVPDYAPQLGPCWIWMGQMSYGYGKISPGGAALHGKAPLMVHRVTYEKVRGPIPTGLTLDHLCRVTTCCNPWHLEPVTQMINNQRAPRSGFAVGGIAVGTAAAHAAKTHCAQGHPYSPENTRYYGPNGTWRHCLECNRLRKTGGRFPTRQRRYGPVKPKHQ